MRRIVSVFSLLCFSLVQLSPFLAFAADKNIDVKDFEVTAPTEVKVNEAFDIWIKAVDTTGKKLSTYEGTVYFDVRKGSDTDVTLPSSSDEWYTFQLSDQGEHTFSKWFTLKKAGAYEIDVYEIDTPGDGVSKTIKITAVDKDTPPPTKADVTIEEPVNKITVSTKTIPVSGISKATSSINILLNGKKITSTQTDKDGKFSATINDLIAGDNTIVAEVLDGNAAVIGTSPTTTIKYSTEAPKINSLTIKEGDEFFAGTSINFVAIGDQNLKTVQVKVGDQMALLQEDKNKLGTYTGVLKTSNFDGEFSANVAVESQLGVKAEMKDMAKFRTVTAKFENVKVETTKEKKGRFTFDLTPDLDRISYFKIKYGTETWKYTKEVITYEKSQIKKEEGKYTWYIPNLEPGEYFSTIIALDKDRKETAINSGEQTFTLALDAAPTCTIEKISGFKIEKATATYSILTWDKQDDAATYQIFKKDAGGQFAMIDEITANKYRINVDTSAGQKIFEDFKVRGICKNGAYVGEGAFSESVKVQTGPELIIFFALFIASGVAFILVRRGYIS